VITAKLYHNRHIAIRLPIAVAAIALMALIWIGFFPIAAPHIRFTAGSPGGGYARDAARYAQVLAQMGVSTEILSSVGTPENLKRLQNGEADVAFAQGGFGYLDTTFTPKRVDNIVTLANVGTEHFWLFTRVRGIESIAQLKSLRIGVAGPQSGSRAVLEKLMELWRLEPKEYNLVTLTSAEMPTALAAGKVDAIAQVAATTSPLVQKLLALPDAQLVHLSRSAAIYERLPYLEPYLALRGSLTDRRTQPEQDTTLLSTHTSLVASSQLHPALQRLVTHAAQQVHDGADRPDGANSVRGSEDLPSLRHLDFPSSASARRVLDIGLPWWEANLPYYGAQVLIRLLLICLPVALVAWWLASIIPGLMHWRLQSQLNRWYGELKFIEHELANEQVAGIDVTRFLARLASIDRDMSSFRTPAALTQRWYSLRHHVDFVRHGLLNLRGR
jgi:uncharacterized protein